MKCYEGNQPYVFLSYAHKDSPAVLPIFEGLNKAGFRIWYDAGTEPGTEWPEYIAEHLEKAEVCLCFLTQSFLDSANCRQELNFALSEGITVLVIYMEEPKLSAGMKMRLGLTQAMFRGRFATEAAFLESLCAAKLLEPCKNAVPPAEPPTEVPAPTPTAPPTEAPSPANQSPAMDDFWDALLSEAFPPAHQPPRPTEPPKAATPSKPTPPPAAKNPPRYSQGLELVRLENGTYSVRGRGRCQDTHLVIPPTAPDGSPVTKIEDSAFSETGKLWGIRLVSVVIPDSVTTVGIYAFASCKKLTSVTLPDSVTELGTGAFAWCESLTAIHIPAGLTALETSVLRDCKSLSSVTIPKGVTRIEDWCLSGCRSLTEIQIPRGVTSVGEWAFCECSALKQIRIPDTVTQMGESVFALSPNVMILCGHSAAPAGWHRKWNDNHRPVLWNQPLT